MRAMANDNFKLEVDSGGIATIIWDMPGRPMNLITAQTIDELSTIVERIASDAAIKGAIVISGKETFCAGADLTLLEGLTHTYREMAKLRGEEAAVETLFARAETAGLIPPSRLPVMAY